MNNIVMIVLLLLSIAQFVNYIVDHSIAKKRYKKREE